MIHSVADTISDEEFAENIEKIIFGHYNKNQPVEEVVEPVATTETETIEETPVPKEEKIEKPKDKTVSEKKSAVEEVAEDTEIEETSVAEVSEDTSVEEDTEIEETEVEEIPDTDTSKDSDFEKIIKGYMLVALHDYGMDCDKDTIDELYQRINSSTALDLYNKVCQL